MLLKSFIMKTNIVSTIQKVVALRMLMFCLLCSACLLNNGVANAKPAGTTSAQSDANLQMHHPISPQIASKVPRAHALADFANVKSTLNGYDTRGGGTVIGPGKKMDYKSLYIEKMPDLTSGIFFVISNLSYFLQVIL